VQTGAVTDNAQRQQWNQQVIDEFRANEGRVGGNFENVPLLLLHTRGARSGLERINPVACLALDGRLYVFGSNGGREQQPGWYFNVVADPSVTVEVGTRTFAGVATVMTGEERQRVYDEQAARMPAFKDYAEQVERTIPVVAIDEVSA